MPMSPKVRHQTARTDEMQLRGRDLNPRPLGYAPTWQPAATNEFPLIPTQLAGTFPDFFILLAGPNHRPTVNARSS